MSKEVLTFPIERDRALHILGLVLTGILPGRILSAALFMIGLLFMGNLGFSPISIIFFIVFILPMTWLLYVRMVVNGRRLMGNECHISLAKDKLVYNTVYPNTMNPGLQELELGEGNRDIAIVGDELSGYQLRVVSDPRRIRFGLWMNEEEALEGARKLLAHTGGKLVEKPPFNP